MTTPLQIALAEIIFAQFKEKEGLVAHQRTDHSLLYGGHDSFGLWIWLRHGDENKSYGMNYDSKEELEKSGPAEMAKAALDDNFLRLCRTKLLTTPTLQEEFLRQLGFLLPPNPAGELGLPTEYDFLNASVEDQASALVAMFSGKK